MTESDINKALLNLEFKRIAGLMAPEQLKGQKFQSQKTLLEKKLETDSRIEILQKKFGLNDTEVDILLFVALSDQKPGISAVIQKSPLSRQGRVTLSILDKYLEETSSDYLTPDKPLRQNRLIEMSHDGRLYERSLIVDPTVLNFLRGNAHYSDEVQAVINKSTYPDLLLGEDVAIKTGRSYYKAMMENEPVVFHYSGDDPYGFSASTAAALISIDKTLIEIRAGYLQQTVSEYAEFAQILRRDLILTNSVPLISICGDYPNPIWLPEFVETLALPLFIVGDTVPSILEYKTVSLSFDVKKAADVDLVWKRRSGDQFEFVPETLKAFNLSSAKLQSSLNSVHYGMSENLFAAARSSLSGTMGHLAQRIDLRAEWDDLILPQPQKLALEQMASFLKHRDRINSTWGFASKSGRGLGMAAVFYGPSGTGKTTAAEALIREMSDNRDRSIELYRVNISSLISKYIGETSKNIDAVFKAGTRAGAALLFDEAEGLFAKRTNSARDSIDKHSNAELGFLLQCLENYQGIAILTTNMRELIDEAFMRRFRFAIEFPFPDMKQRQKIWKTVIPDATPKGVLNFESLARPALSGGNIRSIVINAAYIAAASGTDLTMPHLANAMRLEFSKLDRPAPDSELRRWCA